MSMKRRGSRGNCAIWARRGSRAIGRTSLLLTKDRLFGYTLHADYLRYHPTSLNPIPNFVMTEAGVMWKQELKTGKRYETTEII